VPRAGAAGETAAAGAMADSRSIVAAPPSDPAAMPPSTRTEGTRTGAPGAVTLSSSAVGGAPREGAGASAPSGVTGVTGSYASAAAASGAEDTPYAASASTGGNAYDSPDVPGVVATVPADAANAEAVGKLNAALAAKDSSATTTSANASKTLARTTAMYTRRHIGPPLCRWNSNGAEERAAHKCWLA
jgi:hypothetical protein